MICQNCGTQNGAGARYCENCGAPLETSYSMPVRAPQTPRPLPEKKMNAWSVALVIEIAMILAGCALLYHNTAALYGAKKTGERYFAANMDADWEKAYEQLGIAQSEFINADAFARMNRETPGMKIAGYSVREQGDLSRGYYGKDVVVTYRVERESSDRTWTIPLKKEDSKKWGLFDDWKVLPDDMVCKDFEIRVPAGASAELDEISIEKYLEGTQEGFDRYVIPSMFYGMHVIQVIMDGLETEKAEFDASGGSYVLNQMKVSRETEQKVLEKAGSNLKDIYAAAMQGKLYDEISGLFSQDLEYGIADAYQELSSSMQESGSCQAETLEISSVTGTARGYLEDGKIVIEANLSFAYAMTYSYDDYWDERQMDTFEGEDEATFYFIQENGNWVLRNLGCVSLYY